MIIIYLLVVLFISTLVRATFGFGDALIAMPLLALVINIKIVTPLVAIIAIIILNRIIKNLPNARNTSLKTPPTFPAPSLAVALTFSAARFPSFLKFPLGLLSGISPLLFVLALLSP